MHRAGRDRALDLARADEAAATPLPELGRLLAGRWTGTLDYRDFGTDRRVVLPTQAEASAQEDGIAFAFANDDGPGKRVTGTQRWRMKVSDLLVESGGSRERFRIVEQRSTGPGELTLVFDGEGRENGAQVLVRTVLVRRGEMVSLTRMTRTAGAPFLMRHVYWLRAAP